MITQQNKIGKMNNWFGFYNAADFAESLFRSKNWIFNLTVAVIASMTTFITDFMWDSPEAIWTLWVLMGIDWLTGIIKSIKKKEFVSYKLFRMPLYFIATSFLVSISWWIAKSSIIFYLLPGLVIGGFYSVYFISLLENLGELDLLPKQLLTVLKNRFGLKVIVDKYFKNEDEDEEKEDI